MTIGVEFATKTIKCNDTIVKLQIWDTAGQETFKAVTRSYYRDTIGCLMVYDIAKRESFASIVSWMAELKKYCDPQAIIALVGNKTDLEEDRQVLTQEGKDFAEEHGLLFFETSARTGSDIDKCFLEVTQRICDKILANEVQILANRGIKLMPSPAPNSLTGSNTPNWGCSC
jgi:small GTP-binding protein